MQKIPKSQRIVMGISLRFGNNRMELYKKFGRIVLSRGAVGRERFPLKPVRLEGQVAPSLRQMVKEVPSWFGANLMVQGMKSGRVASTNFTGTGHISNPFRMA